MMQKEFMAMDIDVNKVSLDAIAGPILKKFKAENPEIKENEVVYFNCMAEIGKKFKDNIFREIGNTKSGKSVLFIDDGKIDPAILKQLGSADLLPSHNVKLLAIYP